MPSSPLNPRQCSRAVPDTIRSQCLSLSCQPAGIRRAALCVLAFGAILAAQAGVHWASPAGAASWANSMGQSPLNGADACALAAANANAVSGDTVYLRAGTYGTGCAPANSGTSAARITFKAYSNELVTIFKTGTGLNARSRSYLTFDGINTDSTRVFADLRSAHHVWVMNCTLVNSSDTGGWPVGVLMYTHSRYNRIINCVIGNSGYMTSNDDIGGLINIGNWSDSTDSSGYNLLEGTTFFHGGHHIMEIASHHNVIRNNTFHNENWTPCNRPSVGNLCGNRDIIVEDDYNDAVWNVIEGNRLGFAGASIDDNTGNTGLSIRQQHTIVRNNMVFCNDGPGMTLYADGSGSFDPRYSRIYHNVFYRNGISPLSKPDFRYTFGLLFDNVYGNGSPMPITGVAVKNNLFYHNTGGDIYFYYTSLAPQAVAGNYYAAASNNSTPMAPIAGNTISTSDPLFADTSAAPLAKNVGLFDFRLRAGSPAIDKAAFLTTTAGSGTGTTATLADASYFTDGFGIVEGDLVQFEGQSTAARIANVNYTANTITLDRAMTWTNGLGVALAYAGSAPDIGAFEYAPQSVGHGGPRIHCAFTNRSGSVRVFDCAGRLLARKGKNGLTIVQGPGGRIGRSLAVSGEHSGSENNE